MKLLKNILLAFAAASFFSLFYISGLFSGAEERIYDMFLRFRANRERIDNVVFLDVDDDSIAYNGVFPWPRSVTADGLLRLKEYGALAAVFDIEFIDKGPQGVDTIYLDQGLPADFTRAFSGINQAAQDIFSSLRAGRIGREMMDGYAGELSRLIAEERDGLFSRAQSIARDNDLYLAQASALFGKSWVTLNLRNDPLKGEQAERRPFAEEHFSRPLKASENASRGKYVDVLPPLPVFGETAIGAGFTNVEVDSDGIRRRIYLAQNIHGHWYLQLAFSPLVNFLDPEDIELEKHRLTLKNAALPGGTRKDIRIPLDGGGRMMLDWPRENYRESYEHISFAQFSLMSDIEAELEQYGRALGAADVPFFSQFIPDLSGLSFAADDLAELFDATGAAKNHALENCSGDSFDAYVDYRAQSRALLREIISGAYGEKINALLDRLLAEFPDSAEMIQAEAGYIGTLLEYIEINLDRYDEINDLMEKKLRDKFCILGRVDTGTTDIGVNPFWGEYVNVGTHGVVLDTILSESFIVPLSRWWSVLFTMIFVPLFFLISAKFEPLPRTVTGFAVIVLVTAVSALLFRLSGIYFGALGTVLAMVSAVTIREIISYAGSEREKRFIRERFSTYVSPNVVEEIISNPSMSNLGGTKHYMSAIFTDIRGFSTISEQLDPEELVSLLNRYLTAMSNVLLDEGGTIDKYEGDAIIAFFGAPVELKDHARRACISAVKMKRVEKELNEIIQAEKLSPAPLATRIGINTGEMVAGNMGTDKKMNYTIMGNAVNLAARLEGVNKQFGTWILAAESSVKETDGAVLSRRIGRVRVVGIKEPVSIYELVETMENATEKQKQGAEIFENALALYENRDWKRAVEGFREVFSLESGMGPSAVYIQECGQHMIEPPDDNWDGVINLTRK